MWDNGTKEETLSSLRHFTERLARDIQETNTQMQRPGVPRTKLDELSKLLARCYFKQGKWQVELRDSWGEVNSFILVLTEY
jgi:serine/threonine-protein kinase mTOR